MSVNTKPLLAIEIYKMARDLVIGSYGRDLFHYALVDEGKLFVTDGFRIIEFHNAPEWDAWKRCYPKSKSYQDMRPNNNRNMWPITDFDLRGQHTPLSWPNHRGITDRKTVSETIIPTAVVYQALNQAAREHRSSLYIPFEGLPYMLDERGCNAPGNVLMVDTKYLSDALRNHSHRGTVTMQITEPAQIRGATHGILRIPSDGLTTYIAPQIPFDYFDTLVVPNEKSLTQ